MKQRRIGVAGLMLFFLACADGGGGGCGGGCDLESCAEGCGDGCDSGCGEGGCTLRNRDYPEEGAVIQQAVQLRLTDKGLEFLEANAGPLAENVLGEDGGLSFCIPPGEALGQNYCNDTDANQCTDGSEVNGDGDPIGCQFDATLDGLELDPLPPANADEAARLGVTVILSGIDERFPIGGCTGINLGLSGETWEPDLEVIFRIDPETELTSIDLEITDLNLGDIAITETTGDFACGLIAALAGLLSGVLEPVLLAFVEPLVDDALCTPCDADACDVGSCDTDTNVCMRNPNDCVPLPLGIEGEVDLSGMLSDFNPTGAEPIQFTGYLANFVAAEAGGLTLGMQAGSHASHNACVPSQPAPDDSRFPKSVQLSGNQTPNGNSFMLGFGVAGRAIDLSLWSAYQSGLICLTVGSDFIEQLSSATLGLLLGSLTELTHGQNVPIVLQIRPTTAPTVALGSGEVTGGEEPTIVEPLITIQMDNLLLDFFALIEERMVRIFTLDTDLAIPIALAPSDDYSQIQILLGDLSEAFVRIDASNAELLAQEDVDGLAAALPGLINSFLPLLTEALADPIDVPAFSGYRLELGEDSFTSIDDNTMLAIFANLAPDNSGGPPAMLFAPQAEAWLEGVVGPSADDIALFEARRDRGDIISIEELASEVVLAVDTIDLGDEARVYSYRIDNGGWYLYRTPNADGQLRIRDAAFYLEGYHTIEVRSRVQGEAYTMSLPSDPVEVLIDLSSPRVRLTRIDGQRIQVVASDTVWERNQLMMTYRFDQGEWSTEEVVGVVDLPLPTGEFSSVDLEVLVTDGSGRHNIISQSFALRADRVPDGYVQGANPSARAPVAGCSVGSNGSGANSLFFFVVIGLIAGLRKRRRLALVAVAGLALLLIGCGDDPPAGTGTGQDDDCGDSCAPDEICVQSACVANNCSADDQCPEGLVCVGDRCESRLVCENDSECPDGLFCLDDDDDGGFECLTMPCSGDSDCASITCGSGSIPFCIADICACDIPCPEGCGDDAYCCYATNSCETLPLVCQDLDCPEGSGPAVSGPASGDSASCVVTGPDCECQELPALPVGDVGTWVSSAAGSDGTVYVAAYNRTYGDLMFGTDDGTGTISWEFLDGLPEAGTVTGSLNGPRGGVAENGPDVGRYTSIAVADDGTVHIAYYSASERLLRYARGIELAGSISWDLSTVDETLFSGWYTSITLSGSGVPGIAYFQQRNETSTGVYANEARFAWADAALPSAWTIETVQSTPTSVACGGPCGGGAECRVASNTCLPTTRAAFCSPGCESGESCFENPDESLECGETASFGGLDTLEAGIGILMASDRFADDDVFLAYYDSMGGNLWYAQSDGATFASAVPILLAGEGPDGDDEDDLPDDTGNIGLYPSVTIDDTDVVHLSFQDATYSQLLYWNSADAIIEVIESGERGSGVTAEGNLMGADSGLVILSNGQIQAAYMDQSNHDVVLRRRDAESGLWQIPAVVIGDEEPYDGAMGFYMDQLLIDGSTTIVTYRINTRAAQRDVVIQRVD